MTKTFCILPQDSLSYFGHKNIGKSYCHFRVHYHSVYLNSRYFFSIELEIITHAQWRHELRFRLRFSFLLLLLLLLLLFLFLVLHLCMQIYASPPIFIIIIQRRHYKEKQFFSKFLAGVELVISESAVQCLIHWAMAASINLLLQKLIFNS